MERQPRIHAQNHGRVLIRLLTPAQSSGVEDRCISARSSKVILTRLHAEYLLACFAAHPRYSRRFCSQMIVVRAHRRQGCQHRESGP